MNAQISWHVHLRVQAEQLAEFRLLTDDMVASARAEAGSLIYERFIDETQTNIHLYERYRNSAAAISHLNSFSAMYGERFSSLADRMQFTVFGNPSTELRALLDTFGATYVGPMAGFSRY